MIKIKWNLFGNRGFNKLIEKYHKGDLSILIVGAGALANFVALNLSTLNLGNITIVDDDKIEETNLNRQVLYFDAVGDFKASVLKSRLKKIDNYNKYIVRLKRFGYKSKKHFSWFKKPDLLIDCVDNFETRSILNKFAVKYKIPLISGGTSPLAGQVVMYIPGKTSCLNCELDIDKLAKTRERERQGCTEIPEGSVVTTNQIVGGLMVGELYRFLEGKESVPGTIRYISSDEDRVGFVKSSKPCTCHLKNNIKLIAEKTQKKPKSNMFKLTWINLKKLVTEGEIK